MHCPSFSHSTRVLFIVLICAYVICLLWLAEIKYAYTAYFVHTIQWNTYFEILSYKKAKFTLLHRNILSSHLIHSLLCHEHCSFVVNNNTTTYTQHLMRALVQPRGRHAPPPRNWVHKKSRPRRWAKYTNLCMVWQQNILNNCYELSGGCAPPEPPTRGCARGPRWGTSVTQTPCALHLQILATPLLKMQTYYVIILCLRRPSCGPPEALCFRRFRLSVRACLAGYRHSPTGLPSTSSWSYIGGNYKLRSVWVSHSQVGIDFSSFSVWLARHLAPICRSWSLLLIKETYHCINGSFTAAIAWTPADWSSSTALAGKVIRSVVSLRSSRPSVIELIE